jgi:hypothetical protein
MTEEEIRKIVRDEAYKVCNSMFITVLLGVVTALTLHWLWL